MKKIISEKVNLTSKNIPNSKFEIIIVNDGSNDNTSEEIDKININELKIIKKITVLKMKV